MPSFDATTHRLARCGLLALTLLGTVSLAQAATLQVSAAASMTDAMDDIIEAYTSEHQDLTIVPVYASSSTLARQIVNGAPADLFISANISWMDWLEEQGVLLQERANLLQNRLALVAPSSSEIHDFIPGEDGVLMSLLGSGERLSVGDPDHVPAGIYARQAMEALGEWQDLEDRLARGNDVRAALALVERGETPVGIVYQTDAEASDAVRTLGLFPLDTHEPIVYPVALIDAEDNAAAAAFRSWLESEEARNIFATHGFSPADTSR
ncbi:MULTISPECIES: molybdate ABC transporter substrate-binding protein [unclassified Halomonas]|uniref:molybdate ABC transporter substrate-binding protein n=1 Tax=unclassified Halomonas TaxID=2609666 RepID=UPI004027854D